MEREAKGPRKTKLRIQATRKRIGEGSAASESDPEQTTPVQPESPSSSLPHGEVQDRYQSWKDCPGSAEKLHAKLLEATNSLPPKSPIQEVATTLCNQISQSTNLKSDKRYSAAAMAQLFPSLSPSPQV